METPVEAPKKRSESAAYWRYRRSEKYRLTYLRSHLKRKYGVTLEHYQALLDAQGGGCKICGDKYDRQWKDGRTQRVPLCVDHDHKTGVVRGLLCNHCNVGLALFKEQPDRLAKAIKYLGGVL